MRHFIIATHGTFAKGIYEGIKIIAGEQQNVHIINAYIEDTHDFGEELKVTINKIAQTEDIIICSDIFGGSVNNECMQYLDKHKNVHLITNMNLPLLMQLFLSVQEDTTEMIKDIVNRKETQVCYCNTMLQETEEQDSDEF